MLRRPPRSTRTDTLFPYTTLFRSLLVAEIRPSLIAFRMADLERPTRSAASFGPMEVLLTIAHLVLCTAYRMERGGVQLIGLLYSWQIWFHPWEGWLRRGRKAGTTWQLALPREKGRQTVERRL